MAAVEGRLCPLTLALAAFDMLVKGNTTAVEVAVAVAVVAVVVGGEDEDRDADGGEDEEVVWVPVVDTANHGSCEVDRCACR